MSDDPKREQADYRRIVDDGILENIKALDGGRQDFDATRWLLEVFRLSNPQEVSPVLLSWLRDVFGRILNGEEPDIAFGMRRRRGQKKRTWQVDPIAIAMFVHLKTRNGAELTTAMDEACEYFSREIDTIRAAVSDVEVEPDRSDDELREYFQEHRFPE
jgi:hypothetical protein